MKSNILENFKTLYIYINNKPVWDYKVYDNKLCLIAYDIENELEQVNGEELLSYLVQEEILPNELDLLDEETHSLVTSYKVENNTLNLISV